MNRQIFLLRSIACLAIVLMHSVTLALDHMNLTEPMSMFLSSVQVALMFGTPMFIFISEFTLAYAYPKGTPNGFWEKRIKYILVPFLFMALFYAGVTMWENGTGVKGFIVQVLTNTFIGTFHGYFILIIFQFYLLHTVFAKYIVGRYSTKLVISVSIVANLLYLGLFNFVNVVHYLAFLPGSNGLVGLTYKLPFLAWIAYFTVAYYCGANYKGFEKLLNQYKVYLPFFYVLTLGIFLFVHNSGILTVIHSRRVDVFFYTFSIILLLYFIASKIKSVPKIFNTISQYSFGIYLLHIFILTVYKEVAIGVIANPIVFIALGFLVALAFSMLITFMLNQVVIGQFIVGKLGREYKGARES